MARGTSTARDPPDVFASPYVLALEPGRAHQEHDGCCVGVSDTIRVNVVARAADAV